MQRIFFLVFVHTLLGLLFAAYLFYSENGRLPLEAGNWLFLPAGALLANLAGLAVYRFSRLLNKLLPWRKYLMGRMLAGMAGGSLVALFILYLAAALYFSGEIQRSGIRLVWLRYQDPAITLIILVLFTMLIYSVVQLTAYSYNEYTYVQIETVKLEREQMELQFEALKSQLSPHYLFNCLNTISSLMHKDAAAGETFIRRLAQTYQYILATRDRKLVTLAEEVEFVRAYDYLLKVRYGDALQIEIGLPPQVMQTSLPPLTLQLLIENAFKHNVLSDDDPLHIRIYLSEENKILVSNNCTDTPGNRSSFNIGLENIRKRYRYFTDLPVETARSLDYEVHLPLLTA